MEGHLPCRTHASFLGSVPKASADGRTAQHSFDNGNDKNLVSLQYGSLLATAKYGAADFIAGLEEVIHMNRHRSIRFHPGFGLAHRHMSLYNYKYGGV